MSSSRFLSASEARANSRNSLLIYEEICLLQAAILGAINIGEFNTIVSDGTPMTSINEVQSVTVLTGGSGYEPIVADVTIVHPLGTGADLSVVLTGSVITDFIINSPGSGYEPIEPTTDMSGQGNGDAVLTVIQNGGLITAINVVNPGTGYTVGDNVAIMHPVGTGATAQVATLGGSGEILSVIVLTPGANYEPVTATITVTHPTGAYFDGTVQVTTGAVTGVTILDGGTGYSDLVATATVTDPTGQGAVLQVNETLGVVTSIDVIAGGSSYTTSATVTIFPPFSSSGTGATASVTIDESQYSTSSSDYYDVFINNTTNLVLQDQMEQVESHFANLGYTINIQVNPATNNTIQWAINW